MRVLVTGGAGFIGANLVRQLLRDGHDPVVIDDFSTGFKTNLDGLDIPIYRGSVLDPTLLNTAIAGCDSTVHLAAIPSVPRSVAAPFPSHEANATGTLMVLEAAREIDSHVVVASSSSVYGASRELPKVETMRCRPLSPYAVTKLATESYAISWQSTYGLPTIAFRFFNVFGPLQAAGHAYAAVIPAFLDAALQRKPVTIHGDGGQTRDFTFVDSVTEVLAAAAVRRVASDVPVNLAFGSRRSLLDVVAQLEDVLGHSVPRHHVEPRAGDVEDSQADNRLLMRLFPEARATEFGVGLARTAAWMRGELNRQAPGPESMTLGG